MTAVPLPAAATIVYLHGFRSSPASAKGRALEAAAREHGWRFLAPDLNVPPREAAARVETALDGVTGAVLVTGSSLGGFYALRAAGARHLPCAVVNPCLDPWAHVPETPCELKLFDGTGTIRLERGCADELRALERSHSALDVDPSETLVMLSTADEVLDWRLAFRRLGCCGRILSVDDDHRMRRFELLLPAVLGFFGRREAARSGKIAPRKGMTVVRMAGADERTEK